MTDTKSTYFLYGIISYCILAMWWGCRPLTLPPLQDDAPKFFVEATIAGQPILLEAGVDSTFMHTKAYVEDEREWRQGALAPLACTTNTCGPALGFVFWKESAPDLPFGAEWQWQGPWYTATNQVPLQTMLQEMWTLDASHSIATDTIVAFRWMIDSQQLYFRTYPQLQLPMPPDDSPHFVQLETIDANGCRSQYATYIRPHQPLPDTTGLQVYVSAQPAGGYILAATWLPATTTPPSDFSWSNGLTGPINILLEGGISCVSSTDSFSNFFGQLCVQVLETTGNDLPPFCMARFASLPTFDTLYQPHSPFTDGIGMMAIWYVDAQGHYYDSRLGPQPDNSAFTIGNSYPYLDNDKGQPTQQLEIEGGAARLYDTNGQSIPIEVQRARIAVAKWP